MDFDKIGKQLEKSGKADKIQEIANSKDGERLASMLDGAEVEKAARTGDFAALQGILKQVLSTEEGQRIAKKLGETMKK